MKKWNAIINSTYILIQYLHIIIHYIYFITIFIWYIIFIYTVTEISNNYIFSLFANWARLGELDYNSVTDDARPVDYKIVQHIIHPNYKSPSLYHDIALFRLERDVDFSAYIRPICLNTDNKFTPPAIMATGWGKSGMGKSVIYNNQYNYYN